MIRRLAVGLAASLVISNGAQALDVDRYKDLVGQTISGLGQEPVDVVTLKGLQEDLISIGVDGAREFAIASSNDATLMNFVADNAQSMTAMSLEEIEYAWHDGDALAEIGVSVDDLDHFGPVVSHMDAIIHPATALIALREYEATGDRAFLLQVKDELSEVVEHLAHIH